MAYMDIQGMAREGLWWALNPWAHDDADFDTGPRLAGCAGREVWCDQAGSCPRASVCRNGAIKRPGEKRELLRCRGARS